MAYTRRFKFDVLLVLLLAIAATGSDVYLEWNVSESTTINPVSSPQPVITINGMFPGPLIDATTNDVLHINIFNNLDEDFLMTWNGIQNRLNNWQDGVSGTNCPIRPGKNWTYVIHTDNQIGSFFYFPTLELHKAGGGFGPIRIRDENVVSLAEFDIPDAEFDLLIGDWSFESYKTDFSLLTAFLMNGKQPYDVKSEIPNAKYESINVTRGKTYLLRISNVGTTLSFNFRIQNHEMMLFETEGCNTQRTNLESLDVHVGQSYSVLITTNHADNDYYMVATPKLYDDYIHGLGLLHYENSTHPPPPPTGHYPVEPDATDLEFSVNQAWSIRMDTKESAVTTARVSQTFILYGYTYEGIRYTVNNISYQAPNTPLKLADHFGNGAGVYELDTFPLDSFNNTHMERTSVITGNYKEWTEIVFKNDLPDMNSWHLDGFGFYVVGFGHGNWNPEHRQNYNLIDPVVRSTIQVYPGMWSAVYVYLDNPGMWNLRSQHLKYSYEGQQLYIKVSAPDISNSSQEIAPPDNLLLCGIYEKKMPVSLIPSRCSVNKNNSLLLRMLFIVLMVMWFNH